MDTFIDDLGVIYSEDRKTLLKGNAELTDYIVPEGTESIGDDAWDRMENLRQITLPEGLITIGRQAFAGCIRLTEAKIPKTVRHIGEYAFEMTGLKEAVIPKGVSRLETGVFSWCFNMSAIGLSDTIESLGPYSLNTPEPILIIQVAHSCPLKHIDATAITKGSAFLVNYEVHHEYVKAFPEFDGMFVYGIKQAKEPEARHAHNNNKTE